MKSARNVIAVVECLAADGPLGLSELARRTGIAKSTVQRCIETLADVGWIGPASADPSARVAWALTERFAALMPSGTSDLVELARPVASELSQRTGEAVHLVALDGTDVVLMDRIAGPGPIQVVIPIGFRVPAYAAATGKAMLAALPEGGVSDHLPDRLRPLTPTTVTTRSALLGELAGVRERGWATNSGEWDASIVAVAAAILAPGTESDGDPVLAAISVSSTPHRLPPERIPSIAAAVVDAAAGIDALVRARRIDRSAISPTFD